MSRAAAIIAFLSVGAVAPATAQEALHSWQFVPGTTSGDLAGAGWQQRGAAGLSWPDGRQAVISYWEFTEPTPDGDPQVTSSGVEYQVLGEGRRQTLRCVTYFDANMRQTGDICSE